MFDDLKPGARIRGLAPVGVAEIVQVSRFGADALNVVFRADGKVGERLLYRGEESAFEFVESGRAYAFDADGGLPRVASEASRIRLVHLFDPYLAVSASQIEALPHQITAVYAAMLPRQPLRFLLADDPGAGKTVMAGLLVKELISPSRTRRTPSISRWSACRTASRTSRSTCSASSSASWVRDGGGVQPERLAVADGQGSLTDPPRHRRSPRYRMALYFYTGDSYGTQSERPRNR